MTHFEAIVIGGGPAGASAAIALARAGDSVAVLERSKFAGERFGETLLPGATPLLQELGVWEDFQQDAHLPSPGIVAAWESTKPVANDFIFNPAGNGWHLDRTRFDRSLVRGAERAGASVLCAAQIENCERTTNGWALNVRVGNESRKLSAALLLDATGRAAWLARRQGARPVAADRLVAVIAILERSESLDRRTILEAAEDGWWYAARLPEGRHVAAYMTDSDLLPQGADALRDLWRERYERSGLIRLHCSLAGEKLDLKVRSCNTMRLDCADGSGWIAIGDAALAMDPLSSRGVVNALESGRRAAQVVPAIRSGTANAAEPYATWLDAEFAAYRRNYANHYGRIRRWAEHTFWNRRRSGFPLFD